jgi:DNA-binding GntR family transcriptional regulator
MMVPRSDKGSASQRAYAWTRSRILDGTFAGGTLVSEGEVAEAVKVSRTPVREAFLQLAAENMLELFPKRGALVVSASMSELREVLAARRVIEPWAAAQVANRPDRAAIVVTLRHLLDAMTESAVNGADANLQEADREFHQHLLVAAGNKLLSDFYSSLRDRQLRGSSMALQNFPDRESEILGQHAVIVDAIDRGDSRAAAEACVEHVQATSLALGLIPFD